MKQPSQDPFYEENERTVDLKQELLGYLRYWPWFLMGLFLCLTGSYYYLRYTTEVYQTNAKIKILEENKGMDLPLSEFGFNPDMVNLENEIEIITSYRILERVVRDLELTFKVYNEGTIQTTQIDTLPFKFVQIIPADSIQNGRNFEIQVDPNGFEILNTLTETRLIFPDHDTYLKTHNLPFQIRIEDSSQFKRSVGRQYNLKLISTRTAVFELKGTVAVEQIGKQSDLLQLSKEGQSRSRSERIINTLIRVFNEDGIHDRQLISKRTLDFIDDRFIFLALELDSIELDKKDFKQANDLIYMEADTELGLEKRTQSEEEVFRIGNQLVLSQLLEEALLGSPATNGLLPADVGLENNVINGLIRTYNITVLDRDKLVSSGGINNPLVQQQVSKLEELRANINRSLKAYKTKLQVTQEQLNTRNARFKSDVYRLPEKEKLLRAINRQQKIKESLYLLLLQKREEAAINLAITEPSIKVVEYALSGSLPVSPKPGIVYFGAIAAGLLIPFGVLYLMFMLDTKIHGKKDIESLASDIPVVAEIPKIKGENTVFNNPNDRSILAESFRIMSSNVNYLLPPEKNNRGNVIYCTSTIKGEGKTFVSLNLSLALSSLNKKVLLIGADLRNPQLHSYFNMDKGNPGLSNYLHDSSFDWKDCLIQEFGEHQNHHILLSGAIPPNPPHLLSNGRFEALLEEARTMFDYIVVDTAPTISVTDTLLISKFADVTVYIARANFTEKNLLGHVLDLFKNKKIKNMAFVVNLVGDHKRAYGYGYKYGYNYGYGYGYGSEG